MSHRAACPLPWELHSAAVQFPAVQSVANLPCRKHRHCHHEALARISCLRARDPAVRHGSHASCRLSGRHFTKVRTTVVGNSCSSSTQSDAATYGNTARRTLDASARCSDIHGAVYTVRTGNAEYELTPDHSRAARASAYLPLSATFLKQSSLANHQPGTAVKLRADEDGFVVLVGKRESHYRRFAAH